MELPPIDQSFLLNFLTGLLNTPSPTGFTDMAVTYVEGALAAYPELKLERTSKGALRATWPGEEALTPRALTAHLDTLGAMVREVKPNGKLKLTPLGGLSWNSVESEACTVFAANGKRFRGSLLLNTSSSHVYGKKVSDTHRDEDTMEVRLDERVANALETRALGIEVGDYVAFDPRVEVVNGFIRSRFHDDKAGAACMVAALKALHDAGLTPKQKTYLFFSNFEEVGHGGAAGIPADTAELLTVDMAAIGDGQTSDEFHASICVKDNGGPYHHDFSNRLRRLADQYKIPYKVDIYLYYSSDGTVHWRSGGNAAVALIGPGVDASHNYERTHMDSLLATTRWIMAYLLS